MPTAEKQYSFGGCNISHTSPKSDLLTGATRTLNVIVPFEEALKLSVAIDECIRRLNKYKRSTKEGKRTALNLTIHLKTKRIAINETKL